MIKPKVLYDNVLRGITPTFSGTTLTGKPPVNSTDWSDYTYFTADNGNLDFVMTADQSIDAVSIYVRTVGGTNSIELQYESAPSTFTSLQTFSSPSGTLDLKEFSSVTVLTGRKIRFVITVATSLDIRQLVVGKVLEMEQGAWQSASPPVFTGGVKVTNNISQNGSVLGRSIKRLERMGRIQLDFLSDSFVRTSLEPFIQHAARYPFIYQWSPTQNPDDVAFSFAEKINPAKHSANGYLSFEMPLRMLVADDYSI